MIKWTSKQIKKIKKTYLKEIIGILVQIIKFFRQLHTINNCFSLGILLRPVTNLQSKLSEHCEKT